VVIHSKLVVCQRIALVKKICDRFFYKLNIIILAKRNRYVCDSHCLFVALMDMGFGSLLGQTSMYSH